MRNVAHMKFIRGTPYSIDGSTLHLREFADVEITEDRVMYVYQYMDSSDSNYSLSPLTANSLFQVSKHNPLGIRILVQSARG